MYRSLNPEHIIATVSQVRDRVEERFPQSGLGRVAAEVVQTAQGASALAAWLARPIVPLRVGSGLLLLLLLGVVGMTLWNLRLPARINSLPELIATVESGVNDVVFIGIGVFFLVTLEVRIKRRRALKSIHELRSLAHIIDMHQLTKDPQIVTSPGPDRDTPSSPPRPLSAFELCRYLDYCSELFSLIGKIAALYVQRFDDPVTLSAVDEIENLTTGLSRKVWQKISLVKE